MVDILQSFPDFLRLSATNPNLLQTPYSHEERRILAFLEWNKHNLAQRYSAITGGELVSVIMPTYNRSDIILRAIMSVMAQSYRGFELLIVDDGSTDSTVDRVASLVDPRIRLIKLGGRFGVSYARNVGLQESRGSYIAYLDSDDWWDHNFLLVMLGEALDKGHEFLYSAQRVLRPAERLSQSAYRSEVIRFAPYNAGLLENSNFISQISVLHAASVTDNVGGFDETLSRFVDWDYFLRVADVRVPLAVPAVLSHYEQGATGTVSTTEEQSEWRDEIWRRNSANVLIPDPLGDLFSAKPGLDDRPSGPLETQGIREHRTPLFPLSGLRPNRRIRDSIERRVTVVIPSYEVPMFLHACIWSLRAFTPADALDVVIVDNASGSGVQEILADLATDARIDVVRNPANLGFSHAVAQGIEASDPANDIVILNNDAMVTPGWLEALSSTAHRYDRVGIVAPRQVLLGGDSSIKTHVKGANPAFECDVNLSGHHRNVIDPYFDTRNAVTELGFVPFFCVLIRREAIAECGNLRTSMGVHYQSDWVYCDAVRHAARRRILHTPASKVYHFNGRSTRHLERDDVATFHRMRSSDDWRGATVAASRMRRRSSVGADSLP